MKPGSDSFVRISKVLAAHIETFRSLALVPRWNKSGNPALDDGTPSIAQRCDHGSVLAISAREVEQYPQHRKAQKNPAKNSSCSRWPKLQQFKEIQQSRPLIGMKCRTSALPYTSRAPTHAKIGPRAGNHQVV
jgi:hypothetical protein